MIYAVRERDAVQPLIRCSAQSTDEERTCVGYAAYRAGNAEHCLYCYDQRGQITDLCFRPFILVGLR